MADTSNGRGGAIMGTRPPISGKAVLTLGLGLLSVACGILAVPAESDLLVFGALVFWFAALGLGIISLVEIRRASDGLRGRGLVYGGIGFASCGIVLGILFVPPVLMVREAATRIVATNNLKRIVHAMVCYADAHGGRLPPAVLRDRAGHPLHSWRVLLLPYLEEEGLYQEFRLDEAWDSPHNLALLSRMPRVYAPPRGLPAEVRAGRTGTFYQVCTGPGTAFDGPEGLRLPEDFPDKPSNTILVVEAAEPVLWTKPEDLNYDPHGPLPRLGGIFTGDGRSSLVGRNRVKQFHAGLGDESVRGFLDLSEATLRNAITRDDGQPLGPDW
jgi:hypothetical protein